MNSIFSSFDAVCAELLGQRVKASLPSSSSWNKCEGGVKSHQSSTEIQLNTSSITEAKSSSPAAAAYTKSTGKQQQQKRAARFAPELDGLNCFETLVSY
ncbi:hypothetical protein Vadar_009896 [Vaccinium darrowii]|uniref:Uncharacterized protein n=1 Tax=Vaccinium darrowii TaxID=229202 RepID=A0ACB7XH66_9ERIC|nr:hypothetical protein Vadar_009896 [Vaccinium darrowii]